MNLKRKSNTSDHYLVIKTLSKVSMNSMLHRLISMESNWVEIGEKKWTSRNFKSELPDKWRYSSYLLVDGVVAGYTICSTHGKVLKLNKIIIDSEFRGLGLATRLWEKTIIDASIDGITQLEFKVHVNNVKAINLYKKLGCIFTRIDLGPDGKSRFVCKYVLQAVKAIPHSKPTINDLDIESVTSSLSSLDLATGKKVYAFEENMRDLLGRKYAFALSSGTTSLYIGLKALGIKAGDEVIIPSYICYSVMSQVLAIGAIPIPVDINADDFNISLISAKQKINKKTKAVIVAHMFGESIKNIGEFVETFRRFNIPVIEDFAHSLGGNHNGKMLGSFGTIAITSFYATKMISAGNGGMLLTDSEDIARKVYNLTQYDNRDSIGEAYNFRMSDIEASLGISQLQMIGQFIKRRKTIASMYSEQLNLLSDLDALKIKKLPNASDNIFYRYVIKSDDPLSAIANLRNRGVYASRPVFKPMHRYLNLDHHDFANAESAYLQAVSIPIYPSLSDEDIIDIIGSIANWQQIDAINAKIGVNGIDHEIILKRGVMNEKISIEVPNI